MSYINSTLELHLYGWVGDRSDMIEVVAYCDADLAGDRTDAKSTSGVLVCLVGPRTYMPITAVSKKQTSVLKCTPEAEIVALDHGISRNIKGSFDARCPLAVCHWPRFFRLHHL